MRYPFWVNGRFHQVLMTEFAPEIEAGVDRAARVVSSMSRPELARDVLQEAIAIQQIPSPTFHEAKRAAYIARVFAQHGLADVEIDERSNVYGTIPGASHEQAGVMVVAHTDTIFSAETDLTVRRENGLIFGPGLGDNSIGVAALVGLARALQESDILPDRPLYLVATSGEEGLGDLGGIKLAFSRLRSKIASVINLEGLAFGHVYHGGISVRRLHVQAVTPGGHSWLHFGRTSAVHAILELGARLTALRVPQYPRTTFNIGMIEGGQAINAIASRAALWLDLRSEERSTLEAVERQVRGLIDATTYPDLTLSVNIVGDRPGGYIPESHPLVQTAMAALARVGVRGSLETGSTDANIPLSEGCPAVTIGITRGGNAHRVDEFIEVEPIQAGMEQLLILVLAASANPLSQS